MTGNEVIDLGRQALVLMLVLGAPVLLIGLAVGLVVGLLQAVTQVQEQTLSFVPKILATLVAIVLLGPWMMQRLIEFSRQMFGTLP
jgi:flagellar biosynthetic protein FliQ